MHGNTREGIDRDFSKVLEGIRDLQSVIIQADSLNNARNAKDAEDAHQMKEAYNRHMQALWDMQEYYSEQWESLQ